MKNSNKLKKIFNHFRLENQIEKLKEEINELIEAIAENNIDHIAEEFCDVQVLLHQIALNYNLGNYNLREIKEGKINRTLDRIKSGYYDIK